MSSKIISKWISFGTLVRVSVVFFTWKILTWQKNVLSFSPFHCLTGKDISKRVSKNPTIKCFLVFIVLLSHKHYWQGFENIPTIIAFSSFNCFTVTDITDRIVFKTLSVISVTIRPWKEENAMIGFFKTLSVISVTVRQLKEENTMIVGLFLKSCQ